MKTKKSEKADLERKRALFFTISLVVSLGLVFAAFSWKTPVEKAMILDGPEFDVPDDFEIPLTKEEKKEEAPPVFTVDVIELVDDLTEIEDEKLDIFNSEVTDEGVDVNSLINLQNNSKNVEEDIIHSFVDEMPEFPGGMKALLSFIGNSVKYPTIAQETGVKGKVIVSFVINKDGHVSDASVIRSIDTALDKEALRVVNMMPAWRPGRQAGKAVRVSYVVPINFVLQ